MIRSILLSALLAAWPAPAARADVGAVRALLTSSSGADPAARARQLAGLGSGALPDLFAAWIAGRPDGRDWDTADEDALVDALASFGIRALRAHLEPRLAKGISVDERRAGLVVLARIGVGQDVALAHALGQAGAESGSLAAAIEGTVTGLLRRDPRALDAVDRWAAQAPPEVAAALVRAIGASACANALSTLAELLAREPSLAPAALPEIGRLAERAPARADAHIAATVIAFLDDDRPDVLREAALAAGRVGDSDAIPHLVELLDHPHAGVRDGALRALERLSGLSFGARAERWRAWYEDEDRWLRARVQPLRAELRDGAVEVVVQALAELGQHRIHRDGLAAAAALALQHASPIARRLACTTLARLGSPAALPALQRALGDPDESVQAAAREGLASLGAEPVGLAEGAP